MNDAESAPQLEEETLFQDLHASRRNTPQEDDWVIYTYGPPLYPDITWRDIWWDGCGCFWLWPSIVVGGVLIAVGVYSICRWVWG